MYPYKNIYLKFRLKLTRTVNKSQKATKHISKRIDAKRLEAGDEKRTQEQQEESVARGDRDDLVLRHTPRATVGDRRKVFSCSFPRLV